MKEGSLESFFGRAPVFSDLFAQIFVVLRGRSFGMKLDLACHTSFGNPVRF